MPNGPQKITGLVFDPSTCQSEHSITDEETKKLLSSSTKAKKPNKKKKAVGDGNKVSHSFYCLKSANVVYLTRID